MAEWSEPPLIVYSDLGVTPFIATDENSNSVAVWFDISGTGSMQAATLASGAVNAQGQPNWIGIDPVATSDVQTPSTPYAQAVGMSADGTAMAVWVDGTYVYVAMLNAGETTWSLPTIINTPIDSESVRQPYIAVAANGYAVVTWFSSSHPYDGAVLANVFNPESTTWLGQVNLLGSGAIEFNDDATPVAIDPSGNAVVAFSKTSNDLQAASYNVNTNTWNTIPSIATDFNIGTGVAIDESGNAIIVWIEADNTMNAALLPFEATTLTSHSVLSSSADTTATIPRVVIDALGNAVTAWTDTNGDFASARYSATENTWQALPSISFTDATAGQINLSGDSNGNVVSIWSVLEESALSIQSATLKTGASAWTTPDIITSGATYLINSQVKLTPAGDAIALWENNAGDDSESAIESSIFLGAVGPLPPSSFTGKVILNKFMTQVDRVNQLTWVASLDPETTEYRLYRNSTLLAIVPADGSPRFSYDDHNTNAQTVYQYKLVALDAEGEASAPLYVILN